MINQRYLEELRHHCETAIKTKDRSVEVDARALAHLICEVEQARIVALLVEGRPLPEAHLTAA